MAMKAAVIFCIFAAAFADEVSPIQKVVQMLSDLQTKVIGEGTDAQKVYSEFAEWCETRSREVQFEIKTGKSNAASLQATIDEEGALIASLDAKYEKLAGELAADEADLKASSEIRDHEYAVFVAQEAELSEVVDTLGRAATIIEREMSKGGASMMQLKNAGSVAQAITIMMQASEISSADGARLTALIQSSQDSNDAGAPAGAVYESQSGNILDVLSDLRQKARTNCRQPGTRKPKMSITLGFSSSLWMMRSSSVRVTWLEQRREVRRAARRRLWRKVILT